MGERFGIYVASKTRHAHLWRALRGAGFPIISTWIDEVGAGETGNWADLWDRCEREVRSAAVVVAYAEEGDQLKGALVEVGMAIGSGCPAIVYVGPDRAMGTVLRTPRITRTDTLSDAFGPIPQRADAAR